MQVKEIDINTGKIMGYGICKKNYKISLLGGPTTPTYSTNFLDFWNPWGKVMERIGEFKNLR